LLVNVTGSYRTNPPMQLRPFSDVLCVPIWVLITPDSYSNVLCSQLSSSSEIGSWWEMFLILVYVYLCHTKQGFLTCRKILRHGTASFTYRPKEGVLHIFIAFKNHSLPCSNSRTLGPREVGNGVRSEDTEMKITIFLWVMMPCTLFDRYRIFVETFSSNSVSKWLYLEVESNSVRNTECKPVEHWIN
jgi:hypothetical protein